MGGVDKPNIVNSFCLWACARAKPWYLSSQLKLCNLHINYRFFIFPSPLSPNLCINCIQIFVILFTPALAPISCNYANRSINSDNEIWGCACQASENQGDRVPSFPAPKQSTTISNFNCQSRLTLKTVKSYISINECPLFQILMLEWKLSMRNESFLQILGKSCLFRYNGWVLLFSESSCQISLSASDEQSCGPMWSAYWRPSAIRWQHLGPPDHDQESHKDSFGGGQWKGFGR